MYSGYLSGVYSLLGSYLTNRSSGVISVYLLRVFLSPYLHSKYRPNGVLASLRILSLAPALNIAAYSILSNSGSLAPFSITLRCSEVTLILSLCNLTKILSGLTDITKSVTTGITTYLVPLIVNILPASAYGKYIYLDSLIPLYSN